MLKTSPRRIIGGVALAVGLVGLAVPSATAVETDLGDLLVTPTSGPATSYITVDTPEACPDGTVNFKVSINGTGITSTADNNLNGLTPYSSATPNAGGGISVQAAVTLKDVFTSYGIVSPTGTYDLNLRCQNSNGGTIYGDFLGAISMAPNGTPFEGTYTFVPPAASGDTTTTTLAASPVTIVKAGTATTLTATVSPSAAAGSVQFKRGTTNIGSPVAVSGGTAVSPATALPAGTQSLTAVFTSTDTNAYLSSTSDPLSYVVAGPATITGTVKVGKAITCSSVATAGATKSYTWYVGTSVSATTAGTLTVPATWSKKSIKCDLTSTRSAVSVTWTSAAKTVAPGTFTSVKKPVVSGTALVGKTLTCSKGSWSPTPSSYKYNWYRGTTLLSGKVYSTYKTSSLDKGKYIACRVTAVKSGYTSLAVKSAARKIS